MSGMDAVVVGCRGGLTPLHASSCVSRALTSCMHMCVCACQVCEVSVDSPLIALVHARVLPCCLCICV